MSLASAAAARKPAGAWRRPGGVGGGRGVGVARRRAAAALLLALVYAAGLLVFLLGGRLSGGGATAGGPCPAAVTVASSLRRRTRGADAEPPHAQRGSVYRSHLVFERLWPAMRDDATLAASASSLSASASWRRSMVSAAASCCSRGGFLFCFVLFLPAGDDFGSSRAFCLLLCPPKNARSLGRFCCEDYAKHSASFATLFLLPLCEFIGCVGNVFWFRRVVFLQSVLAQLWYKRNASCFSGPLPFLCRQFRAMDSGVRLFSTPIS